MGDGGTASGTCVWCQPAIPVPRDGGAGGGGSGRTLPELVSCRSHQQLAHTHTHTHIHRHTYKHGLVRLTQPTHSLCCFCCCYLHSKQTLPRSLTPSVSPSPSLPPRLCLCDRLLIVGAGVRVCVWAKVSRTQQQQQQPP